MQNVNTAAFIKALTARVNEIMTTYYDEAPTSGAFPYSVINGINIIDIADGDLISFYIDIWVDERQPEAGIELERACDNLRNGLYNAIVAAPGVYAHIGFDNQNSIADGEFDLAHRRLAMSARIFYY